MGWTLTLERLFMVLRMLDIEISLAQTSPDTRMGTTSFIKAEKEKPSAATEAGRIVDPTRKKESW